MATQSKYVSMKGLECRVVRLSAAPVGKEPNVRMIPVVRYVTDIPAIKDGKPVLENGKPTTEALFGEIFLNGLSLDEASEAIGVGSTFKADLGVDMDAEQATDANGKKIFTKEGKPVVTHRSYFEAPVSELHSALSAKQALGL